MLKTIALVIAMATLSTASVPQQKMTIPLTASTLISLDEIPSIAYKALLKIGLNNNIPIGIVVGANKSICTAPLIHLKSGKKVALATLIDVFNRDIDGYIMALQNGVINVQPTNAIQHSQPLLEVQIPEFESSPASMARMSVKLYFTLQSVIAPEKNMAFAGGMSPAAETIPAIELRDQGLVSILNTIVAKGHGGVWVIRNVSLTSDMGMPFEVRSYIGEDQLILQLALC